MSKCPLFEELSRLVDADLAADQERKVRQHIDGCDKCRRKLDGLVGLKRTVERAGRTYEGEPSADLHRAVTGTLPKQRRRPRS